MRAQIVTVINTRACGPAPMMMGNLHEEAGNHDARSAEFTEGEDGELYRLETRDGKRVSAPSPGVIWAVTIQQVEGGAKTTKSVFVVDPLATSELTADPTLTSMEEPRNPHPVEKALEHVRKESKKNRKMCQLCIVVVWSFEVLSDHGDTHRRRCCC